MNFLVGYWKDEIETNDMIRIQGFDNSTGGRDYSSVCLVDRKQMSGVIMQALIQMEG